MSSRTAWIATLFFALVAGYFVAGHHFYHLPIGLDASAWPAGESIQQLHQRVLNPDVENATAGAWWLDLSRPQGYNSLRKGRPDR